MDKLTGTSTVMVTENLTAAAVGSGLLPVFSTPSLIAMMENAAVNALAGTLDEGVTTVGTMISIEHLAATPLGMEVTATAVLTEQDGRAYTFEVEAHDGVGLVGKGTHKRFAVKSEKFMAKAESRKAQQ